MNAVAAVTKKHITQNAETEQDQEEYDQKYHALVQQYEKLQQQFTKLQRERAARINRMDTLHHFLETISAVPQVLDSFDEKLWRATIEKVTVFHDGKMIFQFLDGTEIQG